MVLFYECCDPNFVVYMGTDKFENEKLLASGFPEDVWFHVDKHSSAHVYLRIPMTAWRELLTVCYPPHGIPGKGEAGLSRLTEKDYRSMIPDRVIEEMCTLVKGNSIEGCKLSECDIVWTPFANLKKDTENMDVGTVGFNNDKQRWNIKDHPKNKDVLKRIEKTKTDRNIDLSAELEQRQREEISFRKQKIAAVKSEEREEAKRKAAEKEAMSYDSLHANTADLKTSNDLGKDYKGTIEECREQEDDFM